MSESGSRRVAFLGPPGTFSHDAVLDHFGESAPALSVNTIDDVFAAVEAAEADFGVVPVENSTEGAVNNTQDCLIDTTLVIVAEVVIPIEHNFLIHPDADPEAVQRIVSHRQSLAQCRQWLKRHWPSAEKQEVSSNSEAARLAARDPGVAAVAGLRAAQYHGLKIQARRIQDQSNNSTRFLVLARSGENRADGTDMEKSGISFRADRSCKTSLLIYAENRPGALFRILEPFERQQVSLTKIETRPARDSIWTYVFFIDFEGDVREPAIASVLEQLRDRTVRIKVLGSYPMASATGAV